MQLENESSGIDAARELCLFLYAWCCYSTGTELGVCRVRTHSGVDYCNFYIAFFFGKYLRNTNREIRSKEIILGKKWIHAHVKDGFST